MAKIVDPDQLNQGVEVVITTGTKDIELCLAGNLNDNSPGQTSGVTLQAVYSFLKEEWRTDANLNKFRFPIKAIYEAKFLMQNSWVWKNAQTRDLIRDAGWKETNNAEYCTIISLGTFDDDAADKAYYQRVAGFGQSGVNYDKFGRLNEPIMIYDGGSNDYRNYHKSFLRIQGKTFDQYNLLVSQGYTALTYIAYRLPLTNKDDIKIDYADNEIIPKDTGTITMDVVAATRKFTRSTGSFVSDGFITGDTIVSTGFTNGGNNATKIIESVIALEIVVTDGTGLINESGDGNEKIIGSQPFYSMKLQYYKGTRFEEWAIGQNYILKDVVKNAANRWFRCIQAHTGAGDKEPPNVTYWEVYPGEKQIGTSYYAFNREIRCDASFKADSEELYAFAQYRLRQAGNINDDPLTESYGTVNGQVANPLCSFVGDTLHSAPGVWFHNFDPNITNSIVLWSIIAATAGLGGLDSEDLPKTSDDQTFPFVSAGNMLFNSDLTGDSNAKYWMYFDNAGGSQFDTANAIIVNDNDSNPITGNIGGQSSIAFTFDYDGNNQGGRTPGTDAVIWIVAMGLVGAEWIVTQFTITKATGLSFPTNAPTERNFSNP